MHEWVHVAYILRALQMRRQTQTKLKRKVEVISKPRGKEEKTPESLKHGQGATRDFVSAAFVRCGFGPDGAVSLLLRVPPIIGGRPHEMYHPGLGGR